eukprot:TRINITY_DN12777_c0_g1_i1.p1 TRINITY_DN12777_c0_g1~~TRINITY_DN12777_c0_g1_i1.p1  ORF type:complete len:299 (-),score=37.09 TRINITY_DN12777_c0_g1_i1:104-1000(-)
MSLITPKISATNQDPMCSFGTELSAERQFEGVGLKSLLRSAIDVQRECLRPRIFHDPHSSPFMPHFSDNRSAEFASSGKRADYESPSSPNRLEYIVEMKGNDFKPAQYFKLPIPITELGKEQISNFDIFPDTRHIEQRDVGCLRDIISAKTESSTKKTPGKRSHRSKLKAKVKNRNLPQQARKRVKPFMCKHCSMGFSKAQALGGHMSRTHPGESREYRQKKSIRKSREMERIKLLLAKRKFFESLNYDYDDLLKTPEGKMRARMLLNRTHIKKLKKTLTKEELDNFIEKRLIDDISN